ncbi:MAG TPA: 5-formyltetrahydrofolate cyclo-ligase [Desulfurivibrionaceae bacterium]|nr:5-formyltetrahydrofolate cyclo-ligase [Desulfurivibrionaceae bacterium]
MASQKELRRQILAARDRLPAAELEEKSAVITERLFQLEVFLDCRAVMFYASFRSEVQTREAMARCLKRGVRLALPLSLPASRELQPRVVDDLALDLRSGYCGIAEPDPDQTEVMPAAAIEAVIVPGSVFDSRGGRLGYGGGYYDRFLAREAPKALRIGLAFALQLVPGELPLAEHDQRLDYLVTEEQVLAFPR